MAVLLTVLSVGLSHVDPSRPAARVDLHLLKLLSGRVHVLRNSSRALPEQGACLPTLYLPLPRELHNFCSGQPAFLTTPHPHWASSVPFHLVFRCLVVVVVEYLFMSLFGSTES